MEKNIIVLDHFKNEIGSTYEKRAKQLVKKARAQWLNANTISIFKESEKVAEGSKMSELWEITSQSNGIKKEKDLSESKTMHISEEIKSFTKHRTKDYSLASFIFKSLFVAILWFFACLALDNQIRSHYDNLAEFIFFIGLFVQVLIFGFELSTRIKIGASRKSTINKNDESFMQHSITSDLKFIEFIQEEVSSEQLKKDIIKSMNDKRHLILHSCAYIIVVLALTLMAYVFSVELLRMFVVITFCLWTIGVFMHWVHYLTEVTNTKVIKEMYKIKNQY